IVSIACALFPQNSRGVPLNAFQHATFHRPYVQTQEPLLPSPHGGTIFLIGKHFRSPRCLTFPERTTGSLARVIQARDRRPGPLAIRSRNPATVSGPERHPVSDWASALSWGNDESQLVGELQAGSESAFDWLVTHYHAAV